MVIYLDEHKSVAPARAKNLNEGNYGDEIMNSNWNPAVVYLANDVAQHARSPELPEDLSTVDVDEFLDRVYALATQI